MYTHIIYNDVGIWNVEADSTPDAPGEVAGIPVGSYDANSFTINWEEDGESLAPTVTGNFTFTSPVNVFGNISGTMFTITVYVNGVVAEYREWSDGYPLDGLFNYDFQRELSALSGNDLFVGSSIYKKDDEVQGLAGNDRFMGYGDGQWGDKFYGGDGIDTAVHLGKVSEYTIKANIFMWDARLNDGTLVNGIQVEDGVSGRDGIDQLNEVERLEFSDAKIALDLAPTDNAGQAVLFIGVLAPDLVATPDIVGLILDFVDDGMSMQQLNQLAVDIGLVHDLAGGSGDADVARMAFKNVVGGDATPDMVDLLVGFMDGRSANFTQSEFLTAVANLEVNQANVDLVGLAQTGIEYAVG